MAKYIDDYQRGSAQKGLRQEDLVNFQLEVVKKEFQEKICDYLDQKMFNQGLISTTINNKINLLYSYKTSLINEFVNGGTNV
ncbi:hypothetical protein FACS189459_2410 [Bacilli bacterium]|nr:hypothetical protein FACS189459_2410 [Bacilli bacterium]